MKKQITTDFFWDCECNKNYIHSKRTKICRECNMKPDDQPDSRAEEVLVHFMKTNSGLPTKMLMKDMQLRMQNGTVVKLLDNSRTKSRLVEVIKNAPAIGDTGSIYVHDVYCAYLTEKLFVPIKLSHEQVKLQRILEDENFFRR